MSTPERPLPEAPLTEAPLTEAPLTDPLVGPLTDPHAPAPATATRAPADDSVVGRAGAAAVRFVARHWLAIFNTLWGLYIFAPFLAAIFMQMGWIAPARAIYFVYSYTCHQLPDHSYFLFGPWLAPDAVHLVAAGMPATDNLFIERLFVGNAEVGYKVALCQRDVAIYAGVFAAGLAFVFLRRRIKPLPGKWFLLLMVPMAIDGGTQLFGWRESNWLLRTLTGALFGVAAVWWAYPYVQDAMDDVLREETRIQ